VEFTACATPRTVADGHRQYSLTIRCSPTAGGLARRKPLLRVILDSKLRLSPASRIVKSPTTTSSSLPPRANLIQRAQIAKRKRRTRSRQGKERSNGSACRPSRTWPPRHPECSPRSRTNRSTELLSQRNASTSFSCFTLRKSRATIVSPSLSPPTRVTALAECPDSSVRPGLRH